MKCEYYGKNFVSCNNQRKYCSENCAKAAKRELTRNAKINRQKEHEWAVCLICSRQFRRVKASNVLYCSTKCRSQAASQQTPAQDRAQAVVDKQVKRPTKTLDDWAREAAACGLDYGNYRALVAQGKSFDEIKAQYHSNRNAHVRKKNPL